MLSTASDGIYSVYAGLKNSFTDTESFVLSRGLPLLIGSAGALYLSGPAELSEYVAGTAVATGVAVAVQALQGRKVSLGDSLDEDLLKIITALSAIILTSYWNVEFFEADYYTALLKGSSVLVAGGAIAASLFKIANEVAFAHKGLQRGMKVNQLNKTGSIIANKAKGMFGRVYNVYAGAKNTITKATTLVSKYGIKGVGVVSTGLFAAYLYPQEAVICSVGGGLIYKYPKVAAGLGLIYGATEYPSAVLPVAVPAAIAYAISKRKT